MVVAYHVGLLGGGFVGVDVFFVISGYVIVGGLARELARSGRVSWLDFYARRVRRLAPAAVLMLVVTIALGWLLLDPLGDQQALGHGAIAAATSTSNFYFLGVQPVDYFTVRQDAQVYLHTWSLAVEEQFYLVVPLIFAAGWLIGRRRQRQALIVTLTLVSLASLAAAIWLARSAPQAGFFLPVSRGYEFGIGALLALVALPQPGRWGPRVAAAGGAVLLALFVVTLPKDQFPGAWGLVPALATAGVIWAGTGPAGPVTRVLSTAPAVGLGKLSYGWYLWHWPLLSIATAWNLRLVPIPGRLVIVLLALGAATVSHRYVEQRFRRPRQAQTRPLRARAILSAIACSALIAAGSAVLVSHADQARETARWKAVSQALKDDVALPKRCTTDRSDREKPGVPCTFNHWVPGAPTVVVWGDSHARMYLPAVRHDAERAHRHVNVVGWTLAQCPPYLVTDRSAGSINAPRETVRLCDAHNAAAVRWVDRQRVPIRVVMAARWPLYRHQAPDTHDRSAAQLANLSGEQDRIVSSTPPLLEHLATRNIRADVVTPVPNLYRPAPYCLAREPWPFDCNVARTSVDQQLRDSEAWLRRLVANGPRGTRLIDIESLVCNDRWCFAKRAGRTLFHDSNHLTEGASRRAARYFDASVAAVVQAP